jgi:DNA-binding PadR family transcriptional regulator
MLASSPDPHSFLPLHPLELRVLLILAEGTAHGYGVVKEIEAREKYLPRIYPANLYRRIRDLLRKGLLEDAEAPDGPSVDARRRYFQITELGQAVLRAEVARMKGLLSEAKKATLLLERLRARP